jgi:hypothetical protein
MLAHDSSLHSFLKMKQKFIELGGFGKGTIRQMKMPRSGGILCDGFCLQARIKPSS